MNKIVYEVSEISKYLIDDITLLVGGFGLNGIPEKLIQVVNKSKIKNLHVVSNNCGIDDFGLGILLRDGQINKLTVSYIGGNKLLEQKYLSNEIEVDLTPQGTLAEKLRAGGAGIPGFYTATGVGTLVAEGKEHKNFKNKTYILEEAIEGNVALVKAWKADKFGNLMFRKTARNFNPLMAKAATVAIAEVEEFVEVGELDPDSIHLPGIYIQAVIVNKHSEKRIEQLTIRKGE